MSLSEVQNIILVLSGKGGVGKSSITTQLALTFSLAGYSVGVLDVDLTGPSIPRMFGVEDAKVVQGPGGWVPIAVHPPGSPLSSPTTTITPATNSATEFTSSPDPPVRGALRVMSLGFLLPRRGDAVVWRGPKKTAMVHQFLSDVAWGPTDILLIDTPPGTSDEHIALAETLLRVARPGQLKGAVVVTTPQAVATADVRKELNFCAKTAIPVLGVVENMSGFVCPKCSECTNIFMSGGGHVMAQDFGVRFLASVPVDPQLVVLLETGRMPRYPADTEINGHALAPPGSTQDGAVNLEGKDDDSADLRHCGILAEKYRHCSLSPIFRGVVDELRETAQIKSSNS